MYPNSIHPWDVFRQEVEKYKIDEDASPIKDEVSEIFYFSLDNAYCEASNEVDEQYSLNMNLSRALIRTSIVHSLGAPPNCFGRMNFCVMKDETNISIICECKSTHNLLLPMTAAGCKSAYDLAYTDGANTYKGSRNWSNVAHPIGQLVCCMIDNQHRYGALTSGTRTYFLKIQGPEDTCNDQAQGSNTNHITTRSQTKKMKTNDAAYNQNSHVESICRTETNKTVARKKNHPSTHSKILTENDSSFRWDSRMKVYISDAWCVGEANYLRAWAYMHTLHESVEPMSLADWTKSSPNINMPHLWNSKPAEESCKNISGCIEGKSTSPGDMRDSGNGHCDNSAKSCNTKYYCPTHNMEYYFSIHQGALDYIPFDELVIGDVIVQGRNGPCYKVKWNGMEYAMKQFDIGQDGDVYFVKEVRAYMLLQRAWGVLVPRPMFLSESYSGGVMLLGLQLCRVSRNVDDSPKFHHVVQRLATEYGMEHDYGESGHAVIITDTNGIERVAAIDFENWREVQW